MTAITLTWDEAVERLRRFSNELDINSHPNDLYCTITCISTIAQSLKQDLEKKAGEL